MAKMQETAKEAQDFLDSLAGQGLENMDSSAVSTSYLSIVQPRGVYGLEHPDQKGHFQNTGTGTVFGSKVNVVVVAFKQIWNERNKEGGTVGRYEPGSIAIKEEPVPRGQRGFPKKINPETGNEIVETFMYAVVFPEYPEEGVAIFIPTKSSLKQSRKWNTMMRSSRTPSGAPAPIFGFVWEMSAEIADEKTPTEHARLKNVARVGTIAQDLYASVILPARQIQMSAQLAIAAPDEDAAPASADY